MQHNGYYTCGVAEGEAPMLVCNVREHAWCKACQVAWHGGLSCDHYTRQRGEQTVDNAFQQYTAANRIVRCPTCNNGLQKIDGCNHLLCVSNNSLYPGMCQISDYVPVTHAWRIGARTHLISAKALLSKEKGSSMNQIWLADRNKQYVRSSQTICPACHQ